MSFIERSVAFSAGLLTAGVITIGGSYFAKESSNSELSRAESLINQQHSELIKQKAQYDNLLAQYRSNQIIINPLDCNNGPFVTSALFDQPEGHTIELYGTKVTRKGEFFLAANLDGETVLYEEVLITSPSQKEKWTIRRTRLLPGERSLDSSRTLASGVCVNLP